MNYIEWGHASGTAYNSLLLTSKKVKMKIIDINNLENRKDTNEEKKLNLTNSFHMTHFCELCILSIFETSGHVVLYISAH